MKFRLKQAKTRISTVIFQLYLKVIFRLINLCHLLWVTYIYNCKDDVISYLQVKTKTIINSWTCLVDSIWGKTLDNYHMGEKTDKKKKTCKPHWILIGEILALYPNFDLTELSIKHIRVCLNFFDGLSQPEYKVAMGLSLL